MPHIHAHDHHRHAGHRSNAGLPPTVMAASAVSRVGIAFGMAAVLWLAVFWAIAKP